MAISIPFFTFIMPLSNVEKYYPGGVEALKKDRNDYEYDNFLCRTATMGWADMEVVINFWKSLGAVDIMEENGVKKFKDFCITERFFSHEYLSCDWLVIDDSLAKAWHKDDYYK
jgi:hypothetical protein